MRIVNLIEDTPGHEGCAYEHGLSFYIETAHHHLLMDTGASPAFLENAKLLGIDLGMVDTVILSHGHYDHTGGVLAFIEHHPQAAVYIRQNADGAFYRGDKYIGIDPGIFQLPQLVPVEADLKIDEELQVFTGVTGRRSWPEGNTALSRLDAHGMHHQDDFSHEQYLVISEASKHVLLSGCAHNGILNILDRYRELYHSDPDVVISGFHMMKKTEYSDADIQTIQDTARELAKMKTIFYTGHCTGTTAYEIMKEIMGNQLSFTHSGVQILP